MTSRKGIGGRPRERDELKRAPISIRTDPALKDAVKAVEQRKGLSFTQAVEHLLRLGLERDAA